MAMRSVLSLLISLRVFFGAMASVGLVVCVTGVNLDYPTADRTGFRIPANVVADLEMASHR